MMKNTLKLLLAIVGLFVYHVSIFAQVPDYSGTWVLNLEKSKLQSIPNGLTSSVFIIKQEGNEFTLKRYLLFGEKKKKINIKMIADGKTRRIKLLFKGRLEWNENSLRATIWRKNFSNIVNYTFGASANELIADETLTSKPDNHHNVWIFEKQTNKSLAAK